MPLIHSFAAIRAAVLPFRANGHDHSTILLPDREAMNRRRYKKGRYDHADCRRRAAHGTLQVGRVGVDPEHDAGNQPDGSRVLGEHRRRARCTKAQN